MKTVVRLALAEKLKEYTPSLAEMIVTIDTRQVFAGDGATKGGVRTTTMFFPVADLVERDALSSLRGGDICSVKVTKEMFIWDDSINAWEPISSAGGDEGTGVSPEFEAEVKADLDELRDLINDNEMRIHQGI